MDEELTGNSSEDKNFTVQVDETSECKRTLTLNVSEGALQAEKKRIAAKLRTDLQVPGFRKGKVPASYVEKNYSGVVHSDAVQNLLAKAYEEAILGEGLRPLAEPRFEDLKDEEGQGISVKAHIEVKPDVEIEDYKGVSVEAQKKQVGDEQVNQTLDSIRESMATYQSVDRPAGGDDYVVIDFAPYLDTGELDEQARQRNYGVTLESDGLLPEFKEGLRGMAAGDEKEILVRYPEDFAQKDLAGGSKNFHVKVTEVKEKLLPVMDDAFAKNVSSDVESLEDLKKRVREDLQKEEDARHIQDVQEKIIDKIIENNPFQVPEAMVDNYLTSIVEEDRRRRPKVDSEEARDAEVRHMFREPATRMVKRYLIMEAVVRQENLSVSEDEFSQKVASLAEGSGRPLEEVQKVFRDPKHKRNLENELLDQKVLNFLREKADIKVV
jgi:trigger factor